MFWCALPVGQIIILGSEYHLAIRHLSLPGCPCGWKTYRGSCYKFDTSSKKSWDDARSACLAMTSDLVSIGNYYEQVFIVSETRKYGRGQHFWIGLNDKRVEGIFEWSDGSPATYTAWNRGEPNNWGGNEDCAEIAAERLRWNDNNCRHAVYFICKRRQGKAMLYQLLCPPVRFLLP